MLKRLPLNLKIEIQLQPKALINCKKWQGVLVVLNPVRGKEISKIRPCLVIFPRSMSQHLHTIIIAPLTSTIKSLPSRLLSDFGDKAGKICFAQMRAINKQRIIKVLGTLDTSKRKMANQLLQNMFSEPQSITFGKLEPLFRHLYLHFFIFNLLIFYQLQCCT